MVRRLLLPALVLVASLAPAGSAAAQLPPYPVYPTPSVPAVPAQPTQPEQGTQSAQPAQPSQPAQQSQQPVLAPITIRDQTDGVNALRVVIVAAFCRGPAPCAGTVKLVKGGQTLGKAAFSAAGKTTFKTPIRLKAAVFRALHKAKRKRMKPTLTLTQADGQAFSRVITIRL